MPDGIFVLPVSRVLGLPAEAAEKLIGEGDGDAALLYIYILKNGGRLSVPQAASAIGRTVREIRTALKRIEQLGLAKAGEEANSPIEAVERDAPPEYSAEDIKREMSGTSKFGPLVREVQALLGKVLSSADLTILLGIYDYLGLPAEVMLLLINHCIEEYREKFGAGRVPTMRTIEKKAYSWARKEIFTLEDAEAFLKRLSEMRGREAAVKSALGIGDRALSPTESKYISSWLEMGFEPETLEIAYDKTVVKTGKLSWAYMNSIVCSWHSRGLHSAKDIEAMDAPAKRIRNKPQNGSKSEPEGDEIARLERILHKMRSE